MADEARIRVPIVLDEHGYLCAEIPPVIPADAKTTIVGFLDAIDPAQLGDLVLREFDEFDPMKGALEALKLIAQEIP